jgi:hypothetical protein
MQCSLLGIPCRTVAVAVVASLWLALTASAAPESQTAGSAGNLITHVSAIEGQPLVVTVIDTNQRAMAVYFVDRQTGEITLKSVRNLTWDLQMSNFNTGKPLPQDIRGGLPK